MALNPSPNNPFRRLHSRIRRERALNPDVVLHFDSTQGDLNVWKWYAWLLVTSFLMITLIIDWKAYYQ